MINYNFSNINEFFRLKNNQTKKGRYLFENETNKMHAREFLIKIKIF